MRCSVGVSQLQRRCAAAGRRSATAGPARHTIAHLRASTTAQLDSAPSTSASSSAQPDDGSPVHLSFPTPRAGHFVEQRTGFAEEHRIRGYEVGVNQMATALTISNLLQEVAGNHAVAMWGRGNGFANMPSMQDLLFVMTRLQFRMHEYPRWGSIVRVETYFTEDSRLTARRDWRLLDGETGRELGAGTSTWVTINVASRRLSKLPEDLKQRFMKFSPPVVRHAIPVEETKRKLPDVEFTIEGPKQLARRSDMDMNGHINNVTYLAWALETVPEDVLESHNIYEVEMDFKAECTAGQVVDSLCCPMVPEASASNGAASARQFLHLLRRCDDQGCHELVRARTTWKPRPKA